jgi:hypothetical protein
MINKCNDFGLIQTYNYIFSDKKSGYTSDISSCQFLVCCRINIDIFFDVADFVLRKKLFRRGTVRSGFGSKHDYVLHY